MRSTLWALLGHVDEENIVLSDENTLTLRSGELSTRLVCDALLRDYGDAFTRLTSFRDETSTRNQALSRGIESILSDFRILVADVETKCFDLEPKTRTPTSITSLLGSSSRVVLSSVADCVDSSLRATAPNRAKTVDALWKAAQRTTGLRALRTTYEDLASRCARDACERFLDGFLACGFALAHVEPGSEREDDLILGELRRADALVPLAARGNAPTHVLRVVRRWMLSRPTVERVDEMEKSFDACVFADGATGSCAKMMRGFARWIVETTEKIRERSSADEAEKRFIRDWLFLGKGDFYETYVHALGEGEEGSRRAARARDAMLTALERTSVSTDALSRLSAGDFALSPVSASDDVDFELQDAQRSVVELASLDGLVVDVSALKGTSSRLFFWGGKLSKESFRDHVAYYEHVGMESRERFRNQKPILTLHFERNNEGGYAVQVVLPHASSTLIRVPLTRRVRVSMLRETNELRLQINDEVAKIKLSDFYAPFRPLTLCGAVLTFASVNDDDRLRVSSAPRAKLRPGGWITASYTSRASDFGGAVDVGTAVRLFELLFETRRAHQEVHRAWFSTSAAFPTSVLVHRFEMNHALSTLVQFFQFDAAEERRGARIVDAASYVDDVVRASLLLNRVVRSRLITLLDLTHDVVRTMGRDHEIDALEERFWAFKRAKTNFAEAVRHKNASLANSLSW